LESLSCSVIRRASGIRVAVNVDQEYSMAKKNPVFKFLNTVNKPSVERDKTKYRRKPKHKQKERLNEEG